jgi:hypothetical protein
LRAQCLERCTKGYERGKKDCLTVVADLFETIPESKKWELNYIANMPCQLLSKYGFTPTKGMKPGHILFVGNEKGRIRHAVIGLPPESNPHSTEETEEIFHCSQANGGGKIETLRELFAKRNSKNQRIYCEIKSLPCLLFQMDLRTTNEDKIRAITNLAHQMLALYLINPASWLRSTTPRVNARLMDYRPTEETKTNDDYPSIIIPKNPPSCPRLTMCSPIYLFNNR